MLSRQLTVIIETTGDNDEFCSAICPLFHFCDDAPWDSDVEMFRRAPKCIEESKESETNND